MNKNSSPSTVRKVILAGILTAGVGFAVPGVVQAETCVGQRIHATHNNQVIYGTCGDDLIKIGQYKNVTVHAGDGHDDVRSGTSGGGATVYLGEGNDTVSNNGFQPLTAFGEGGNDHLEGSSAGDFLDGGSGNDTLDAYVGASADVVIGGSGVDVAWAQQGAVMSGVENMNWT